MNPFNPLSIVQSTFESADVQHELKELVEIIRAYDIYDFLRRLSALNLQKENQNRAVLLDALQSAILYNDETYYTSSAKMSAGKFSSIIKKMDSISLVHAIDPNENVFTQNVMLYDNYTVFNGIDSYPAYRLQMLCEIFFGFKNSFPLEYIYHFSLCFEKNATAENNAKTLGEYVTISGGPTRYTVTFTERSLMPFNCETNRVEKEYITLFLDCLFKTSSTAIAYNSIIEHVFSPPFKKKIVSFDIQKRKYLKPVLYPQNTAIRPEDEDRLSSFIGQQVVESHRWNYGPVFSSDGEEIVFSCVNTLYDMLKREVSEWSPIGLLEKIYSDLEEVISSEYSQYDRYRYDVACYPEKEDEYLKQLNDVNRLSMALKFLAEYPHSNDKRRAFSDSSRCGIGIEVVPASRSGSSNTVEL